MEFVLDTISSIDYYIHGRYKIIVADDSQNPSYQHLILDRFPDVVFVTNKRNLGKALGLYTTLCHAYTYALDHFEFPALLRLDTDALIIGHGPDVDIVEYFRKNPTVGLAGRYVNGLSSTDDFGNVLVDDGRIQYIQLARIHSRLFLKHPLINWRIRKIIFKTLESGYQLGELIFGGAYAFSRIGLEKLRERGLLPMNNVIGPPLCEDHFFTLLIWHVGLTVGDMTSGDGPFACAWKELPASPETLHNANKKIIHSTRWWQDMNEAAIRKYFRERREAVLVST